LLSLRVTPPKRQRYEFAATLTAEEVFPPFFFLRSPVRVDGTGSGEFRYNSCMLQRASNSVVYCAVDDLISSSSRPIPGFFEFLDELSQAKIPCVWISTRTRLQLDSAIRKVGQSSPFIAEGGCGVYLPEDYFHLKPSKSVRFARFTVIPVAAAQPAATEALDSLAEDSAIEVVPLRSMSPRELAQNAGVPQREAELLRQRDFDEFFFFAGASDAEITKFQAAAKKKNIQVRPRGTFWSLAVGANLAVCIRELSGLYERTFRTKPFSIGIASSEEAQALFASCNRAIFLRSRTFEGAVSSSSNRPAPLSLPLTASETWETALSAILEKRL
jgi:mannosyl-3-phosphoglycerate phosphatase